ncbi:MAG TPA: penicillin-binding protein [Candidatus Omnitrophica bacterium]|nr:penicillin-binding protein [Candidatus Omnitrophota bacterium]
MHIRRHVLRLSFIFLFFIGCLLAFSVKLVLIQVFKSSHLAALAEKQHNHIVDIEPVRGTIYDRNLRPLALNVPVYSLFANPKAMSKDDKLKAIKHLSGLLNLDAGFLQERLNKNKYFIWIKRKLSLEMVEQIKDFHINGMGFREESRRYYPNGNLSAHIIGFAGTDNEGLEGLELFFDKDLKGRPGRATILRDARQRELLMEDDFAPPQNGFHLVLTIDETIQFIAERALEKAFEKHHADGATIILMDTRTGEILALANRPTYNPGDVLSSAIENRTNRAISYILEPGSVFKIVTATAALEEGVFNEGDKIFCENGEYRVANHILHDHHPHGTLTFREVFELSSNIGVTKIAQKLGAAVIYQYAQKFHFGEKTGIDLLGEVGGMLKHPSVWSKTSIGAIPIGQEVTTTPLQLVCAMAAIANNGVYMRPFVVKYVKDHHDQMIKAYSPQIVDRVMSEATAKRVTEILAGVVETGTGKLARIDGIRVAGKTGTAQKVVNGTYSHSQFFATFVGFAPADNPRVAAVIVVDDPHPDHFGGTVSGPVFKEVVENTLKYLEASGSDLTEEAFLSTR